MIRSFCLRSDESIVYEPSITREPVYMEDLVEKVSRAADDDGGGGGGTGGAGDDGEMVDGKGAKDREGAGRTGGKRPRRALFGALKGWKKSAPTCSATSDVEEDGETYAAVSNLAKPSGAARIALLSQDRNALVVLQIYFSKKQVDQKLLARDGTLSWVDRCRRKKDQRMDRFVLQYHIRQFGTKKLARRNLQHLCKSITRLALTNPRISASEP
ncbi:unnamed protein product [Hapterophycus canaliculatus]